METAMDLKLKLISLGIRQIEIAYRLKWDPGKLSKVLSGWLPMTPRHEEAIRRAILEIKSERHGGAPNGK